jgi:hypothetical protein
MTATPQDFKVHCGDSTVLDVALSNMDGTPLVIDDSVTLRWVMTRSPSIEAAAAVSKTFPGEISTVSGGVSIPLLSGDTAGLALGPWRHELRLWNGPDVCTLMVGTAVIERAAKMSPPGAQPAQQAQAMHRNRIALVASPRRA